MSKPLTDALVRGIKPAEKEITLSDGRGLQLDVTPAGVKHWRLRYSFQGRRRQIALGSYPSMSLLEARSEAARLLQSARQGVDPAVARRGSDPASPGGDTFEAVAREWHARFQRRWAGSHANTVMRRLETGVFPLIGKRPIAGIKPPDILAVVRRIEARGAIETAHRTLTIISQVFRYSVSTCRAEVDVTVFLRGALTPAKPEHHAALLDPKEVGEYLRRVDAYRGGVIVRAALSLLPLVAVRPGELQAMRWESVDFDERLWCFEAQKTHQPHVVPLSTQAVGILEDIRQYTGGGKYVFPSVRYLEDPRPMSNGALTMGIRRLGYSGDRLTPHGFRATFRTLAAENLGARAELLELQLAHRVKDALGRAYNRTQFIDERRELMQVWADYLDGLKKSD